ncbi:murein DD-endopeptidase MepM/ murein hydrolase activator NlpD [Lysinibacillus composti]|uniref:LysM peptidoglycan-binding domain-containing protein n=1 Tax=Lysinibacillus composti TaxID=720633 RepID=A0A3N9UC90_9BACI|nr:M23 family metallopeptidase [Lysinibacillus composti]MBM7609480.1 murein DD-endopeptidase MepM/ murein hydrolase activator NlpD [Lysinibacillus composti]RQW74010.1 LysM peptidoglycan-binding domain-containing protein [Lysinibacillus composti]
MSSKRNIKKDFTKQHNTLSLIKNKNNLIKKIAATALFSTLTLTLGFVHESNAEESIQKIYHIYVGDSYIGAVSDTDAVQKIVEEKESEASKKYKEYSIDAKSNLSIIPEQAFNPVTNDSKTLDQLNKELTVQVDAFALQVDGKPVAYLKDLSEYDEAIRLLKLEYVSEKQLKELEANELVQGELPKLKNGETRVHELELIEKVSGDSTKINPAKILTPKEAVKVLKTGSLEEETYKVKSGDVLGSIARDHSLTTKELLKLNPNLTADSLLQIGQEINVTVEKPLVNVEVVYEKSRIQNISFEKVVKEDPDMFKGEKVVKQEGAYGKKEVSYLIKEVNGNRTQKNVTDETILSEPKDSITVVGSKVISSRGLGSFNWPTAGGYISSGMGERWGAFHQGIDIARPSNYNIKAADNGVVTFTGWDGSYGNKIVINHNNGYETVYAHLSQIDVSVGQVVPQGSVIGIMGTTGNSTGIHLHFEVHKNGSYVNPLSLLN